MFLLTQSDVIRSAHNDVAPVVRNDVMLARYAARRNIIYTVNITRRSRYHLPTSGFTGANIVRLTCDKAGRRSVAFLIYLLQKSDFCANMCLC